MATVGPILHMPPLTLWRQEVHGYSGTHFTYAPFNSLKARGPWLQWDPFYICPLYPFEGKRPRAKRDSFYPCPFSLTPWRQEAQDYSGTHFTNMPSTPRKQEAHDYRLTLLLFDDKRLMATVEAALCIPLQLFRRLYFCVCVFIFLTSCWKYWPTWRVHGLIQTGVWDPVDQRIMTAVILCLECWSKLKQY